MNRSEMKFGDYAPKGAWDSSSTRGAINISLLRSEER